MAQLFLRLLASLTIFDYSLSQWSIDGKSETFTFVTTKKVFNSNINWYLQKENENYTIFQCQPFNQMKCFPDADLYSANLTSNSSSYISVLTIKNVNLSLHNTRWFCNYIPQNDVTESARYDLKVFAVAENPKCDQVKLVNGSNIQIICLTTKGFPESKCLFTVKSNVSAENDIKQGHISYTQDQNLATQYYKTTCTLVVSAAILGPGSHMFSVVMYPNITSAITEEMKSTSEYTSSIYIDYPRALLGNDCEVQGYIKENEQHQCTCYDSSNSIVTTKIIWLSNQSLFLDKRTLKFTAKRNESFQCTISNFLNWTDSVDFHPKISYPPDTVRLNTNKQDFDLCNDTNIFISGTCFVSESNPEPSIALNINNSLVDITPLKHKREYMFNKSMTSTGIYYISCLANSIEYLTKASSITNVTVKGPPVLPMIFKNENVQYNNILEITKGDTITCQSKDGYPISKNITLKCGQEEIHATNQDKVSMAMNISNVSSLKCVCVVGHESNCLQSTTTVHLKFLETFTTPGMDFEKAYIAFGAAAGCVIVSFAIIIIISQIRNHHLDTISRGTAEHLVSNEDIYFTKQGKSCIQMEIYPYYTNVVTTIASAMEAPKNLNN